MGNKSVASEMVGISFEGRDNGGFITPGDDGGWALFLTRSSLFATSEIL